MTGMAFLMPIHVCDELCVRCERCFSDEMIVMSLLTTLLPLIHAHFHMDSIPFAAYMFYTVHTLLERSLLLVFSSWKYIVLLGN